MSFLFCSRNNVSTEMKVSSQSHSASASYHSLFCRSPAPLQSGHIGGIYTFPSSLDPRGLIFDILRCWKFSSHSHFMRNSRIKRVQWEWADTPPFWNSLTTALLLLTQRAVWQRQDIYTTHSWESATRVISEVCEWQAPTGPGAPHPAPLQIRPASSSAQKSKTKKGAEFSWNWPRTLGNV